LPRRRRLGRYRSLSEPTFFMMRSEKGGINNDLTKKKEERSHRKRQTTSTETQMQAETDHLLLPLANLSSSSVDPGLIGRRDVY